jgi:uncharacterized phage protein (TIGR02218 family)
MKGETIARAWAVSRADGLVLGFTDHDMPLAFGGIDFRPDSGLSAKAVVQGAGLSVDNTEAVGALSDSAITEIDLMAGRWDSAEVRLWEMDWRLPDNRQLIFRGRLGEVSRSGGAFRAELRGLSEPLNRAQGRVYHPRCSAELGDGQCGVNLMTPGYFADAVVQSEREGQRLVVTGVGSSAGRLSSCRARPRDCAVRSRAIWQFPGARASWSCGRGWGCVPSPGIGCG